METTASETAGLHLITISLAYREQATKQRRRCLHKLGVDVPFHDVHPPAGVDTQALEVVHLALNVTLSSKHKRRGYDNDDGRPRDFRDFQPPNTPKTCSDLGFTATLQAQDVDMDICDLESDSDFDELMLGPYDTAKEADEVDHTPTVMASSPAVGTSLPGSRASIFKRSSSPVDLGPTDECIYNADAVLELVDAGLRLAVAGSPVRFDKTVRVCGGRKLRPLRSVAPSIWSPGYLPAVVDRAVFLPSISHALSAVTSRTLHTARLRQKAAMLYPSHVMLSPDQQASLSAHLWRMLQKGEYTSNAPKRLRPLFAAVGTAMECGSQDYEAIELDDESCEYVVEDVVDSSDSGDEHCDKESTPYDDRYDLYSDDGTDYEADGIGGSWAPLDMGCGTLEQQRYTLSSATGAVPHGISVCRQFCHEVLGNDELLALESEQGDHGTDFDLSESSKHGMNSDVWFDAQEMLAV